MMDRTLPARQYRVLAYLATRKSTAVRDVARDMHLNRTTAQNTLTLLVAKSLVTTDFTVHPVSFAITAEGSAVLAAAGQDA
jgi:DNA-binding MarR family transcriptional regulator